MDKVVLGFRSILEADSRIWCESVEWSLLKIASLSCSNKHFQTLQTVANDFGQVVDSALQRQLNLKYEFCLPSTNKALIVINFTKIYFSNLALESQSAAAFKAPVAK